jgi:hypothetical protein
MATTTQNKILNKRRSETAVVDRFQLIDPASANGGKRRSGVAVRVSSDRLLSDHIGDARAWRPLPGGSSFGAACPTRRHQQPAVSIFRSRPDHNCCILRCFVIEFTCCATLMRRHTWDAGRSGRSAHLDWVGGGDRHCSRQRLDRRTRNRWAQFRL